MRKRPQCLLPAPRALCLEPDEGPHEPHPLSLGQRVARASVPCQLPAWLLGAREFLGRENDSHTPMSPAQACEEQLPSSEQGEEGIHERASHPPPQGQELPDKNGCHIQCPHRRRREGAAEPAQEPARHGAGRNCWLQDSPGMALSITDTRTNRVPHGEGFPPGVHEKEPLLRKAHLLTKARKKPELGTGFLVWSGEFKQGLGQLWLHHCHFRSKLNL